MIDNGIYVTNGPNWEEDKKIIETGPQSLVDQIGEMEALESIPIQATAAYGQTSMSNRFQQYTDTWFEDDGKSKTELMDFGLVKEMKVAMFAGLFDQTCRLPDAIAQKTQMGDAVAMWTVSPMQGHVPWGFTSNEWFMNRLIEALMINADI